MNMLSNHENFNGLVNQSLKTTSRIIAERFGKQHKDVLRAIRNLECSTDFNERNFAPVEYLDEKGEKRTEYGMTRDGFTFLAMGFTGKEAAAWKERFIAAFNAMEDHIRNGGGFRVPQSFGEALRLAAEQAEQIETMKPVVAAMERLEASEGSQLPRIAAKALGIPEKAFFRWMHSHNWAFRQGKTWQGYSEKIKQGYLEHDVRTYRVEETGEERTSVQLKITPKGMARLAQIFTKEGGAA